MRFHDPDAALDSLYEGFAEHDIQPLWKQTGLLPETPRRITAHVWRWEVVKPLAERAGALVGVDKGGDRRVLALSHPDLQGRPFATPTLWAGIQYLNPHEAAPPHRHSPGALRFVLEGSGVWTMVNGDPVLMEPGDLVLTPSYNWHAHENRGDEPMIWFDGLDLPMVESLDAVFFEDGPDVLEPYEPRARSRSESAFAAVGVRPVPGGVSTTGPERDALAHHAPLVAYRWEATDAALASLLDESADPHATVRFTDPSTGDDVMPTLRAEMTRIRPSGSTPPQRKVGSSVVVVYRGSGETVVDGETIAWSQGDVLVLPSWSLVEHRAASGADLFTLSDAPLIERAGLGRTGER